VENLIFYLSVSLPNKVFIHHQLEKKYQTNNVTLGFHFTLSSCEKHFFTLESCTSKVRTSLVARFILFFSQVFLETKIIPSKVLKFPLQVRFCPISLKAVK